MRHRVPFQCVSVLEAEILAQRDEVLVLDCRDANSYGRSHIKGAEQLNISNLSAYVERTPKSKPVLIYCYHGHASKEYANVFSDFGFSEVYSMDGGYEAWSHRPRPATVALLDESLQAWLAEQGLDPGDVNGLGPNATTPLMKASHLGQGDIVRRLIAAGAQLDARNADGNNALWLACVGNHLDVIDILVDAGVDIDNRNDNGATSLMYAASSGRDGVVGRLLARGADTAPETLDGFTALDMAATAECLALLRQASRSGGKSAA